MTLANVVRLNFYTTDIRELFAHFDKVNDRFEIRATRPPCSAWRSYQRPSSS
jgi:hypothetical protein